MIKRNIPIIDRPLKIQNAIRATWSPTIIRTRFILDHERTFFNDLYNSCPISPNHRRDKIVFGANLNFVQQWVKSRFTCLGKNWEVGTILLKERGEGVGTWWFCNTSICMPNGTYDPTVIPYKFILIPLQVNHTTDPNEFKKIVYFITNNHYVKNNISIFKISEDYLDHQGSNYNYSRTFENIEGGVLEDSPEWYQKYGLSEYTDYFDEAYLKHWNMEIPYIWLPGSVVILDATRIYGYKDRVKGVKHRKYMTIMTYTRL